MMRHVFVGVAMASFIAAAVWTYRHQYNASSVAVATPVAMEDTAAVRRELAGLKRELEGMKASASRAQEVAPATSVPRPITSSPSTREDAYPYSQEHETHVAEARRRAQSAIEKGFQQEHRDPTWSVDTEREIDSVMSKLPDVKVES